MLIQKSCEKNSSKNNFFSTNKTDILCRFQKNNFYNCQKYTLAKNRLRGSLRFIAIGFNRHRLSGYSASVSSPVPVYLLASFDPGKKSGTTGYQLLSQLEKTCVPYNHNHFICTSKFSKVNLR